MAIDKEQVWEEVIIGPKVTYQAARYMGVQSEPLLNEPAASRYATAVLHHHRDPALITLYFDSKGMMRVRHEYYLNGILDREGDKPALIDYDAESPASGARMEFYSKGKLHRKDGPASADYYWIDNTMHIKNAAYYCEGEKICNHPTCLKPKDLRTNKFANLRKILLSLN